MMFVEEYGSDELWATFAPVGVYWVYAGFYQLLLFLPPMENYRLHTKMEENDKNLVPLASVIKVVLLQQIMQVVIALSMFQLTSNINTSKSALMGDIQPSILIRVFQIMIAMLVMDTWQYFAHRYMHQNKFLYKHIHSWHHRLVVPYAVGAMYNHPIEGLLLDTCSGAMAYLISGMTAKTSTIFYCIAVIKGIDHHCGIWLPWNIMQLLFHNNTAYHDIHHQLQGTKFNFSQPFFPFWDKLLGTYKTFQVVPRPGGGFQAIVIKDKGDPNKL